MPHSVEYDDNQSRWYVSGLDKDTSEPVEITSKGLKDSVYVEKCSGGVVKIVGKINALTINNCSGTGIVFDDAVSIAEVINSKKVQVQVIGSVPTLVVDKSADIALYASEKSKTISKIVSSESSSINYLTPEGDDMIEHPVPYQISSEIKDGKLVSSVVEDA